MKRSSHNRHLRSRLFAPALTLMLAFGLCFPAAASAESFLSTSPKTGDVNNLVLWIAIVAGSAIVLAVLAFLLLRKNKKKKK